jgi:hypothetical protein
MFYSLVVKTLEILLWRTMGLLQGYPWLCFMNFFLSVVHKCLKFPFGKEIFTMHHNDFNHVSSHGNFSLDLFWLEPMEPIRPCEDFFFKSYENFKAKHIEELSPRNMPQPMIEPPILDETMIEAKTLTINQDQPMTNPSPISYKTSQDSQISLVVPHKIKQVSKVKEKLVEKPPCFLLFLPYGKKRNL